MRHTLHPQRRGGFTLVELLVACALTVLIMAVLATAFSTGMTTFSHLKSTVGLSEQLRSAETILRRDLEAVHLQDGDGQTIRVSDPRLANSAWTGTGAKGYFEVLQATAPGGTPFVLEGTEDGVPSFRATDHALFFTSKLSAASAQETFTGDVPAVPSVLFSGYLAQSLTDFTPVGSSAFVGQWAEIGLFLVPSKVFTTEDGVNPGSTLPLFNLIRRQRVLSTNAKAVQLTDSSITSAAILPVLNYRDANPDASISTLIVGMSAPPLPVGLPCLQVNDAAQLTNRQNRLGYVVDNANAGSIAYPIFPDVYPPGVNPLPASLPSLLNGPYRFSSIKSASPKDGTDVLVTNVVSMHIRVMDSTGKFKDTLTPLATVAGSGVAPLTSFPAATAEGLRLDTASPVGVQMRAVQIKLRVYDTKNHLTRQMTMTFDL